MQIIRARKPSLSLDLAPLIDVVFQLLIFFMLTSVFVNPSMKITLPKAVSGETSSQELIIISINQAGEMAINSQLTSLGTLKEDLKGYLQEDPGKPIHIRGDKEMPYKYFVEVMDVARQAGAKQINIVHQK